MKYLLIQDNVVQNIVVADPELVGDLFPLYLVEEYQDGVAIGWSKTESGYEPPPPTNWANWDGFNAAILADPVFNQTTGAVFALAPSVAIALPSALAQVSTNGISAFNLVFTNFCLIGQVSSEQRELWADMAESYNLPSDFVAVVRGA